MTDQEKFEQEYKQRVNETAESVMKDILYEAQLSDFEFEIFKKDVIARVYAISQEGMV